MGFLEKIGKKQHQRRQKAEKATRAFKFSEVWNYRNYELLKFQKSDLNNHRKISVNIYPKTLKCP